MRPPTTTARPVDQASEVAAWLAVGALVGGAAVAFYRLGATVAGPAPAPPADDPPGVAKPVSDRQRAASQRTAKALNSRRVRCLTCGLESAPGPMGGHLKASGHNGTEPV